MSVTLESRIESRISTDPVTALKIQDLAKITPSKHSGQIRQRYFDVKRKLPRSPSLRSAVAGRLLKNLVKSPSTGSAMLLLIDSFGRKPVRHVDVHERRTMQSLVLKLKKYKASKNDAKFNDTVRKFKQKYNSVREFSAKIGMHRTQVQRLISVPKRHARAMTQEQRNVVLDCYSSTDFSLQLPFKRHAKFFYLRSSLSEAYAKYARRQDKAGFRVFSESSVYRCLKKRFRTRKQIPFKDCQCDTCVNHSLLLDALIVAKVKGLKRRVTQNILRSFCPMVDEKKGSTNRKLEFSDTLDEALTDHNRECIFRECQKCGAVHFQDKLIKENPDVDWGKEVHWSQWQKVTVFGQSTQNEQGNKKNSFRPTDKIRFKGSLAQLLTLFTESLNDISKHIFHFRWQTEQFDQCKQQLQENDVMLVMDFAMNYAHRRQFEIQKGFFSRRTSTMHPVIAFYPCPHDCCDQVVKDEIMILSDDHTHDSHAVITYVDKALCHLREKGVTINRIVMWSDNCGAQYKNCKIFEHMSKIFDVLVMRCFFCAKHGKADADGAIGRLSQHLDTAIRSGKLEASSAAELVRYCNANLQLCQEDPEMCCHYQRHYYEVLENQINRDRPEIEPQTVEGTQKLHAVRNTGVAGILEVRESSCFCEVCFINEPGKCKNKRLVKPFAWARVYIDLVIDQSFENKLWKGFSEKFKNRRKFNFIPKSKSKGGNKARGKRRKRVSHKGKVRQVKINVPPGKESGPKVNRTNVKKRSLNIHISKAKSKDRSACSDMDTSDWSLPDLNETLESGRGNKHNDTSELESYQSPVAGRTREKTKRDGVVIKTSTPSHGSSEVVHVCSLSPIPKEEHAVCGKLSNDPDIIDLSHDFGEPGKETFNFDTFHRKLCGCKSYEELETVVHSEKSKIPPLAMRYVSDIQVNSDVIDNHSRRFLPSDLPIDLKLHHLIDIEPDGNCYYRCLSRLSYGDPERFTELRCRITVDSVLNMSNYLNHEYLMRDATHMHKAREDFTIATYYCLYSKASNAGQLSQTERGIKMAYKSEVLRTVRNAEYAGLWQFHSGANVLNCKIFMALSEKNFRANSRPDFNRLFLPSKCDRQSKMLGLLWIPSVEQRGKVEYNHIIPFIRLKR